MDDPTSIPEHANSLRRVRGRRSGSHEANRHSAFRFLSALVGLAVMVSAEAQELEPRAYANLPVGTRFLLSGYSHSSGSILVDPTIRLEDAKAEVHGAFIGYLRALDVAGKSGQVKFLLPYAHISASGKLAGDFRERDVAGLGDPVFRFSVNLYGAPALFPEAFAGYRQDLNIGVGFHIKPPLGQYNKDQLVNVGTNRWSFRSEAGLSKALDRWIIEASASADVFTDNKEFLADRIREQEPIYALQLHVNYIFLSGTWVGLGGTYFEGGEVTTRTDGEVTHLRGPRNSRVGATLLLPIDRTNSIRMQASTSVATRTGDSFDIVTVSWQHQLAPKPSRSPKE